jgi:hypothetical protein
MSALIDQKQKSRSPEATVAYLEGAITALSVASTIIASNPRLRDEELINLLLEHQELLQTSLRVADAALARHLSNGVK